jgi:hypothetical protein
MKNKKTLFIVAGLGALAIAVAYFYNKSKAEKKVVTPAVPESVAKSQKSISDAISKYGKLSNIPSINDKDLALAISNNDLNLALNS